MTKKYLLILAAAIASGNLLAQNLTGGFKSKDAFTGLKISVAVDVVGEFGEDTAASNEINVREAEFMFYAPVDPYLDAYLSFAGFTQAGNASVELHEAYITSPKLIPSTEIKLGRFFLPLGRLGGFHRHEWPFVSTPLVVEEFFGDEGVLDTGLEFRSLLPLPFYADLRLGAVKGYELGHSHEGEDEEESNSKPQTPTHYAKLTFFQDAFTNGGVQEGLNYLGRLDAAGNRSAHFGFDVTAKWGDGFNPSLLQAETWLKSASEAGEDESHSSFGLYAFARMPLSRHWATGLRFDYLKAEEHDESENLVEEKVFAVTPMIQWRASEFSTIRLAGEYKKPEGEESQFKAQLQWAVILGEHPAHDF